MTVHLPDNRVADAVKAFRRLTEHDGPAASLTRTRLLSSKRARRRHQRRILFTGIAIAVLIAVLGGLAAARFLEPWWSTRGEAHAFRPERSPSVHASPAPRRRPAPFVEAALPPPPAPSPRAERDMRLDSPATAELALYGVAHTAHFVAHDAARAVSLWTRYLRRFPAGRFVPEATYNRALALLRSGREREALVALRPIAAGRFGAYRRPEAEALIGALTASGDDDLTPLTSEPSRACPAPAAPR